MISLSRLSSRSLGVVAAAGLAAMMSTVTVNTADAFIFGLFRAATGGGGCHGCSGKEVVPFSKKFGKGTVVVSFADRRLYFISKPGQAISYPIGAPMGKARWSGTLHVSSMRVNPGWSPTAQMRRNMVELLFACLIRILGLGRLRLRGPCGVQDEFILAATT